MPFENDVVQDSFHQRTPAMSRLVHPNILLACLFQPAALVMTSQSYDEYLSAALLIDPIIVYNPRFFRLSSALVAACRHFPIAESSLLAFVPLDVRAINVHCCYHLHQVSLGYILEVLVKHLRPHLA